MKNIITKKLIESKLREHLSTIIFEEKEPSSYKTWKRKNVTLRGIKNIDSTDNNGMAKYGQGLYTAFLGNRSMAKEYGDVYFVVNAIPK